MTDATFLIDEVIVDTILSALREKLLDGSLPVTQAINVFAASGYRIRVALVDEEPQE